MSGDHNANQKPTKEEREYHRKRGAEILAQVAEGMTLRDYFAAQAMPRFILEYNSQEGSARAYAWADAMLKAREQK